MIKKIGLVVLLIAEMCLSNRIVPLAPTVMTHCSEIGGSYDGSIFATDDNVYGGGGVYKKMSSSDTFKLYGLSGLACNACYGAPDNSVYVGVVGTGAGIYKQ